MNACTEDTLVQQTIAEYLEQGLGWVSVYAYSDEDFGKDKVDRWVDEGRKRCRGSGGKYL